MAAVGCSRQIRWMMLVADTPFFISELSKVSASLEDNGTVTFQGDSDALISKGAV